MWLCSPVYSLAQHLIWSDGGHQRETGRLSAVTYIKVERWAFQSQWVREEGGRSGCKKRLKLQSRGLMVLGESYLVPSETRAGRISYRGLFVEETLRLWDSGIVRESPSADLTKRGHGEKFERKERWGEKRRKTEKEEEKGWNFQKEKERPWANKCRTLVKSSDTKLCQTN